MSEHSDSLAQISLCGSITFEDTAYGPCLLIDNKHCTARLSLFGAHLLSFFPKRDNKERLWLSKRAIFDGKTPIRGGIPICWPWFGAAPNFNKDLALGEQLPSHGQVRSQVWRLVDANESNEVTRLTLEPSTLDLPGIVPGLTCKLTLSFSETCSIELESHNQSDAALRFSGALHTYFKVDDIGETEIHNIHGTYFNKLDASHHNQSPLPYLITGETDRVHASDPSQEAVKIQNGIHTLKVEHHGQNGLVVWNPWVSKSKSMKDMDDEGYKTMLCIEAAVEPSILLLAGQKHTLKQSFI